MKGVDGELIILKGKGFKINHKGEGIQSQNSFEIIFADVHFEKYEKLDQVFNIDLNQCLEEMEKRILGGNIFFSKMKGVFEMMHTRSLKNLKNLTLSLIKLLVIKLRFLLRTLKE